MRNHLLWAAIVIVTALIQTTWNEALAVAGVVPDFVMAIVVFFAIAHGEERAMFTGAVGGVFQDVAQGSVLGHHVLCNTLVAYGAGRLSSRLVTEHPAVKAGFVLIASLVQGILVTLVLYVQDPSTKVFHRIVAGAIPTAFYTAIVSPLVFMTLERTFRRAQPLHGETS